MVLGFLETDTGTDTFSSSQMYRALSRRKQFEVQPTSDAGKHLISAILDKGNKLMDSMIRAQCEAEPQGPNLEDLKPDQSHESARWDTGVHPLRRYSNLELSDGKWLEARNILLFMTKGYFKLK